MSEFLSKMSSRYKGAEGPVSPNRIQHFLEDHGESQMNAQDIWLLMPDEVLSKLTSNTGRPKEKKIKKFMRSVEELLEEYKPNDILKISVGCIRKDGSIDAMTLKHLIDDDNEI